MPLLLYNLRIFFDLVKSKKLNFFNSLSLKKNKDQFPLFIGFGLLLLLIFLSLLYWQNRVYYADASFQSFHIINKEQLAIQEQRFPAIIVQLPVLLLAKAQASLATILKTYSLAFTVYPLVFAFICWRFFKSETLALVIIFFFGLTQIHTFFWIQSELLQGCMYSILGIALFNWNKKPQWWLFLIWQIAMLFIVYSHPLTFPIFLFLWAWYAWAERKQIDWRYLSIFISCIAVLGYKHFLGETGRYDTAAIGKFAGFSDRLLNITSLESTKFFFTNLKSSYYLLPILLLINTFYLTVKKQWVPLLFMLGSVLLWLIVILSTFHQMLDQTYMESYYLPLGIFIGLPFIYYIFGKGSYKYWVAFMLIISVIRVSQIVERQDLYQKKLSWLKGHVEQMEQLPGNRFYVRADESPTDSLTGITWATGFESIMLSSTKSPDNTHCLHLAYDYPKLGWIKTIQGAYFTKLEMLPYEIMNPTYFSVGDSLPIRHLPTAIKNQ